jgi:uncharacterized phiE125 gp8 family phage protein
MIKRGSIIGSEPIDVESIRQFIKQDEDIDAEIDLIEQMVKAARRHIEKKTGLSLVVKEYTELFKYNKDNLYYLTIPPVISIESATKKPYTGDDESLTEDTDYYKQGNYNPYLLYSGLTEHDQLEVVYKSGYGNTNTEDCPEDIVLAIKQQVLFWYDNRDQFQNGQFIGLVKAIIRDYATWI